MDGSLDQSGRSVKGGRATFANSASAIADAPAAQPFSFEQPYPSRRAPLLARQAVATSHPLAAQAGLAQLERGGNAVDAALTAAAALTVLEPTMNGVGGDLFALYWDGEQLHGLNASGRSPRGFTRARFAGLKAMPERGWDAVTVPGAVSGWAALARRFGSVPFARLLEPAIAYAREGFPVMPHIAGLWAGAPASYRGFAEFARVFLPGGRAPRAGDWFTLPDLGNTLARIAESEGEAFYRGELARTIARAAASDGGALVLEDLRDHEAEWVAPLGQDFRGARLCELPPNGQGLAALLALAILERLPIGARGPEHPDSVHLQLEAMKAAFAECRLHLSDPGRMRVEPEALLADARVAHHARHIRMDRAAPPRPFPEPDHGTVYVAAADRQGRMVSLIQSNYLGFGSGVVVPGTGISLHNRARGFSLDERHPNCVAGGVRPFHTLMPGFLMRGGAPAMSFGVMGGHMQPQGHVQLVLRSVLYGQNPQAICDAPRWHVTERSQVALEPSFPRAVRRSLERRGHRLLETADTTLFGGAQAIARIAEGYCAGSDPRKDGQAVGS